jgi:hypothetical protein
MHQRQGDAAQLAILEWVDVPLTATEPTPAKDEKSAEAAKS